jgi:hypothetical protein
VRGLGGAAAVTPVAVEVWMSSWENDRGHVESGRRSCAPVNGARSRPSCRWSGHRVGPRGSPSCLRAPRAPRARRKMRRGGSGDFDDATRTRARRRDVARDAYRARGLSVRLG